MAEEDEGEDEIDSNDWPLTISLNSILYYLLVLFHFNLFKKVHFYSFIFKKFSFMLYYFIWLIIIVFIKFYFIFKVLFIIFNTFYFNLFYLLLNSYK